MRFEGPKGELVLYGDGLDQGAQGLFGGRAGSRNYAELTHVDGRRHVISANEAVPDIERGAILHKRAGGGGGYGYPAKRSRQAVADDLADGLISPASARNEYGFAPEAAPSPRAPSG